MINYINVGSRIRDRRVELGLTQESVAEQINISPSFYSQIESGRRKASIKTFLAISHALTVSLDYIFDNHIQTDSADEAIAHYSHQLTNRQKQLVLDIIDVISKSV